MGFDATVGRQEVEEKIEIAMIYIYIHIHVYTIYILYISIQYICIHICNIPCVYIHSNIQLLLPFPKFLSIMSNHHPLGSQNCVKFSLEFR